MNMSHISSVSGTGLVTMQLRPPGPHGWQCTYLEDAEILQCMQVQHLIVFSWLSCWLAFKIHRDAPKFVDFHGVWLDVWTLNFSYNLKLSSSIRQILVCSLSVAGRKRVTQFQLNIYLSERTLEYWHNFTRSEEMSGISQQIWLRIRLHLSIIKLCVMYSDHCRY